MENLSISRINSRRTTNFPTANSIFNSVGLHAVNNTNDVIIIQNLLKSIGYQIAANGNIQNNISNTTIIAILNFQTNNNLRISGIINPNDPTFSLLIQSNSNNNSLSEDYDESLHAPNFINARAFRRNANNANTLNVIFEGDSWLDYPIPNVLDLYDTISDRNQRLNLNCLHLAKFGETTTDMFNDRAKFVEYITNYRIDRIFFSGGGNDLFPQLGAILNPGTFNFSNSFFTDQSKLDDLKNTVTGDELFRKCVLYKRYLNTQIFENTIFNANNLNNIFNTIAANYLRFGEIVNLRSTPNTIFYMHTYDYPLYKLGVRPSIVGINLPLGPWIKPVFDRLQINSEILKCYIIIRLLDKFYNLQNNVKTTFTQRNYQFQTQIIDFRGLLDGSQYWRDEIHPNSAGASRLATRVNF